MTTGDRIQKVRKSRMLSQRGLGNLLGLSGAAIGQWENGLRNPRPETLCKIANALKVDVAELKGDEKALELTIKDSPIMEKQITTKNEAYSMLDESFIPDEAAVVKHFLNEHGFWGAPASTKYHGNYPGGLAEHSLAVAKNLVQLTKQLGLKWSRPGSPAIIGLLHDVCKTDQYELIGKTDGYQYKYRMDSIYSHHGEKSICMLASCITLTEEEIACIRGHMGAYETDTNEWKYYGNAISKYPNVLWTHTADMMASHIEGV